MINKNTLKINKKYKVFVMNLHIETEAIRACHVLGDGFVERKETKYIL